MTSVIRGGDNIDSSKIVEEEDFGVGSTNPIFLQGTMDSTSIPSGVYTVNTATTGGTYPSGHSAGTLEVVRYNETSTQQKFTVPSGNFDYYVRYVSAGNPSSTWERVYTSGASGQLGYRNILINGDFRINQRSFAGNWGTLSDGDYGYDRWKKSGANNQQVVEEGNYKPNTTYTLSGVGISTSTITSPASGHWTITVPNTASKIQLEEGRIQTPFELRNIGVELSLCQRYYVNATGVRHHTNLYGDPAVGATQSNTDVYYPVRMRIVPTLTPIFTNGSFNVGTFGGTNDVATKFHMNSGTNSNYIDGYIADAEL